MLRLRVGGTAVLLVALTSNSLAAQTTTTSCSAWGNNLNCTSNTSPSAEQQYQQSMQQFQQGLANLGAALAQRRAAKAAQEAAWAAAATERAKEATAVAKVNYDATTEAMSRFVADSTMPTMAPVNADLVFDWSLLDGVESRVEPRGEQNVNWNILRRWALIDTPYGTKVFRVDESVQTMIKKQHMANYTNTLRFYPASGIMFYTAESEGPYHTFLPEYESALRVGTHAFATRMEGRGFEVTVPPGTVDGNMLFLAVAAMPGALPPNFRIWIVDSKGEVVPADFQVVAKTTVEEPVGPPVGCAESTGRKEKRDGVTLRVSKGTVVETVDVLAAAPHLAMRPDLKCRVVRH
jgi:hypothetical protein